MSPGRSRAAEPRSWQPHAPDLPDLDDAEPAECGPRRSGDAVEDTLFRGITVDTDALPHRLRLDAVRLARVRAVGGGPEHWRLADVLLEECDLAGMVFRHGEALRVEVRAGRLNGVAWIDGEVRDALLDGVRAEHLTLRSATLRRIRFVDCVLPDLDVTGTRLDQVDFVDCDLRRAQFHEADVTGLRFTRCDLRGADGVERLRQATADAPTLTSLAPSMARVLGIRLADT